MKKITLFKRINRDVKDRKGNTKKLYKIVNTKKWLLFPPVLQYRFGHGL